MSTGGRPLPDPTPMTRPFWEGLRAHKIRIQYSPSSDQYVFYPRALAPGTLADDLQWRDISGRATLYTFAVTGRPTAPPWAGAEPQILAVLEWAEGPRFTTGLIGCDPVTLRIGQEMEPVFVDLDEDDATLLFYRPKR